MLHWIFLFGAIALEVAGTTCMKLSSGFTKALPSFLLFVFYATAFTAMTYSVKRIDVSVAYAVWSGLGTVLISVIGMRYFHEPATAMRIAFITLIVVGVIGLNLSGVRR